MVWGELCSAAPRPRELHPAKTSVRWYQPCPERGDDTGVLVPRAELQHARDGASNQCPWLALGCDSRAPIGTDWAAPRDLPSAASQHAWVMPAAAAGSWRWPGVSQGWMRGLYMSESASSPGCCSCS